MALVIKDRVKETTTSTGTGAVSLGGASATFDAFQSVMSNGDTTFYAIVHTASGTDEWEVGLATWNTGNTLTRTTVYAGSNGTSAVNFGSGTKDVFMTYPASKAVVTGEDAAFANVTVTGTVDGRDVATDGTKLDGIEASADVTDTANVTAAGALMDSEVTNLAQVKAFDSSDYATAAQGTTADAALPKAGGTMTGAITFASGQTFDGRDVSADGSKLDGIESGATADQSASEILTAIKTVDGSSSGLDADLLDGQQGSYYTGYADTAVANLVDSAPSTLDTLNELAAALGDDPNFSTTVTNSIAAKLPLAGGTMTGSIRLDQDALSASGGTLTIDLNAANNFKITMSANTTFAFSNVSAGRGGNLIIVQNATGGYSFTLPAACKTPVNGASIVQSTNANEISILSYYVVDSSNILVNYIGDFA